MPKNLNAFIRYRTLDTCLSNPHRKWKMKDLVEACNNALQEARGIDSGVSERTVREDIRVMRSDILGFNAPIKQGFGNYWYSDPTYSIFGVSVNSRILLERILEFILEIRDEITHPAMEEIVQNLVEALKPAPIEEHSHMDQILKKTSDIQADLVEDSQLSFEPEQPDELDVPDTLIPSPEGAESLSQISTPFYFSWAEVREIIP